MNVNPARDGARPGKVPIDGTPYLPMHIFCRLTHSQLFFDYNFRIRDRSQGTGADSIEPYHRLRLYLHCAKKASLNGGSPRSLIKLDISIWFHNISYQSALYIHNCRCYVAQAKIE